MVKRCRKRNWICLILLAMFLLTNVSSSLWAACDSIDEENSQTSNELLKEPSMPTERQASKNNKSNIIYENNPFNRTLSKREKEKTFESDASELNTEDDIKVNSSTGKKGGHKVESDTMIYENREVPDGSEAKKIVPKRDLHYKTISNIEGKDSSFHKGRDIYNLPIKSSGSYRSLTFSEISSQAESLSNLTEGVPQPGDKINKENIDEFIKFFPSNFAPAFKNGWNLISPISATIKKTTPNYLCAPFLKASKLNRGKYTVNKQGYIDEDTTKIAGLPFPDLTPNDPQFAVKLMWNYEFKYDFDEMHYEMITFAKHGGRPFIVIELAEGDSIRFQNRMFVSPKPHYENPHNIRKANLMKNTWPSNRRRGGFLSYRYADQTKKDVTHYYIPGVRLLVQGSANERSTPITGSTLTLDDFKVFSGRTAEFTYKFVKTQSLLVCGATDMDYLKDLADIRESDHLIFPKDMEIRKVYVIDIIPKDKKYFQSRKRIYIDTANYNIYYGEIWDRAKKFWKIIYAAYEKTLLPTGETNPVFFAILGVDIQLGFATASNVLNQCNDQHLTSKQFQVSTFQKMATR